MARHGENIRKRTDGRWEGRYKTFDENRGSYIYRSVYGSAYEEAKEKLSKAKLSLVTTAAGERQTRTETGNSTTVLFSQAAQEWLAEIADKRKYSTYVKYETVYRIHLAGIIGFCQLSNTAASEIQAKIFDHLSEAALSESLQKSICGIANQILVFANRRYSVGVPTLEKPGIKQKYKPIRTLSKAEQARLLSSIYGEPNPFKIALLLCLYTGLRLGELCALKWTDFDLKNMSLTVSRTVQRIAAQDGMSKTILLETAPKSEGSKRTIPLMVEIMELLSRLDQGLPYVFGGNKPLEPRTMQYRFKKLLKAVDVGDRNFHILRHTFATNCIENGMDVKALSEILGHSDVKITLNRYVHPTMESKRKQLGLLPDFYGQILGHVS
ncbi:MAG: site-specific integrase [Acetatifactor sp.]|nr:site-specific integrase [Acetatifactor sp.]